MCPHGHNLTNTIELSICCGNAALCWPLVVFILLYNYQLEALGQWIPLPRHVLPVPWYGSVIRIVNKIYSYVHWPITNLPWKFHANPLGSFYTKLLTDKQWRLHILLGRGNNEHTFTWQTDAQGLWQCNSWELKPLCIHHNNCYTVSYSFKHFESNFVIVLLSTGAPLIHLLISSLYITFAHLHCMLVPTYPFFLGFLGRIAVVRM